MYDALITRYLYNYYFFLKSYKKYEHNIRFDINFKYYNSNNDIGLKHLYEKYEFNKVVGESNKFVAALKLMNWTFNHILHQDMAEYSGTNSAIDILEYSRTKKVTLNCLCFSTVLTEILLSMGYHARKVYCISCDVSPSENHVVVEVYIDELKKWVMLDPTISGYISDNEGLPLSICEIREKLIKGEKLENCYYSRFASTFGMSKKSDFREDEYMAYLCKDFFRFLICENQDSGALQLDENYWMLVPKGYLEPNVDTFNHAGHQCMAKVTNNELDFWR